MAQPTPQGHVRKKYKSETQKHHSIHKPSETSFDQYLSRSKVKAPFAAGCSESSSSNRFLSSTPNYLPLS
jgi:hypothetical protein